MTKTKKKNHSLLPIFLTVFLAYVGVTLPYPVFSPLFIYPEGSILPSHYSSEVRSAILGVVLALYPFGQFFGSPFLGRLSDLYGRKRVLLGSLALTTLGYFMTALAITWLNLPFLIISRIICGFAEGNVVIAQSAAADMTKGHQKVRSFSYISLAISLGFIIGPILGGKLGSKNIVSWFNYATPFWFSVFMAVFTWCTVYFFFPLLKLPEKKPSKNEFFKELVNFKNVFRIKKMRRIFLTSLTFWFSFLLFFLTVPIYLTLVFQSGPSQIATAQAYLAVFVSGIQLVISNVFAKRFSPFKAIIITSLGLAVSLILFIIPQRYEALFLTLPLLGIFVGIAMTSMQLIVSNSAGERKQGEVLGVNASIIVTAEALAGLLGGVLVGISPSSPFIIAAVFACLGAFFLYLQKKSLKESL